MKSTDSHTSAQLDAREHRQRALRKALRSKPSSFLLLCLFSLGVILAGQWIAAADQRGWQSTRGSVHSSRSRIVEKLEGSHLTETNSQLSRETVLEYQYRYRVNDEQYLTSWQPHTDRPTIYFDPGKPERHSLIQREFPTATALAFTFVGLLWSSLTIVRFSRVRRELSVLPAS